MPREGNLSKLRLEALSEFRRRARRTGDSEGEALAQRLIISELARFRG